MEPTIIQSWLLTWAFTAPRILIAFAVLPILTDPVVPSTLRNGILMILSLFVLPLTHEQFLNIDPSLPNMLAIVVKEGVIGLMLGYVMSVPFWAVKATGFLIDMQRGVMSALFFSQTTGNMVSPIGNLFSLLLTTLLLVTGGFLTLLQTLFLSYKSWPLDQFMFSMDIKIADFFLKQLDLLLYTTLLLAGPMIGIMFLIDLGTGLVGRYLPQLNIFLIAMPIKSGVSFFMLVLYMTFLANYMKDSFVKINAVLPMMEALLR
jgi:type III secretion protein T